MSSFVSNDDTDKRFASHTGVFFFNLNIEELHSSKKATQFPNFTASYKGNYFEFMVPCIVIYSMK